MRAREVFDAIDVLHVTPVVFENAGRLDTAGLLSLDVIPFGAALDLATTSTGLIRDDAGWQMPRS